MSNQAELREWLKRAKMDRSELAYHMGIEVKTTYWKNPPDAAISILMFATEALKANEFKSALKKLLET